MYSSEVVIVYAALIRTEKIMQKHWETLLQRMLFIESLLEEIFLNISP